MKFSIVVLSYSYKQELHITYVDCWWNSAEIGLPSPLPWL